MILAIKEQGNFSLLFAGKRVGMNETIREHVKLSEVYRYLGYGANSPDGVVKGMVAEVLDRLILAMEPKSMYKIYECATVKTGVMLTPAGEARPSGKLMFCSRNLAENLRPCGKAALLAATLGLGADRLMQKYEALNMAKASAVQACAAACIEAYCDILQENIRAAASAAGETLFLRPRFSPGYGDLALENQKIIFDGLECTKRIGITLTDSLLMYPTKSVTAFIGLTPDPPKRPVGPCENCGKKECEYSQKLNGE